MEKRLGLAEAIENLRGELLDAIEKARGPNELPLQIESLELELGIEIAKEVGDDNKISFKAWVVEAELGGSESTNHSTTHTVRLTLKPAHDSYVSSAEREGPG